MGCSLKGCDPSRAQPSLAPQAPGAEAHTAVFIRLTHPSPRAFFPPPPSTFRTSSVGVTTCHLICSQPYLASTVFQVFDTVPFTPADFTSAPSHASSSSSSSSRSCPGHPAAAGLLAPAPPQDSPPAQLDRLSPPPRAAVQLRRAPQAAESAGSNATADPQRRRLPSP